MEFHLYDKVKVTKDVFFENRGISGIMIKAGAKGIIIDICETILDDGVKGYTLELPEYADMDPTFTFSEDCLELI